MCVWVEDADKLEIDSGELNIVFSNHVINDFLNKDCLGLAGIKGQGKTFLIKVKRKMDEQKLLCLPTNKILDTVDSSLEIDRSIIRYLSDYNVWVNVWKFSISAAIIKKIKNTDNLDFSILKNKTKSILSIQNNSYSPSVYFQYLLQLNLPEFRELLSETSRLLDLLREHHDGIRLYIDKIDQGFSNYIKNFNEDSKMPNRSRRASFWQYAQYSLAEASYDIYSNINHHIKVYFTIRQEALIDTQFLNKDKARNINAYISKLVYSKKDLKEMYELYIKNEKDANLIDCLAKFDYPSKAFVGYEDLPHGYVPNKKETVFDYIYRHTFKRPYDIMKICRTIAVNDMSKSYMDERTLRHLVNAASNELLETYIQELSSFLPDQKIDMYKFVSLIPGNILTKELMEDICSIYHYDNAEVMPHMCNKDCTECEKIECFSTLYNIGILGNIQKHPADKTEIIKFENIGAPVINLKVSKLPESSYYVLHPALSNKIRDDRNAKGLKFYMCDYLIVGDGYDFDVNAHKKQLKEFAQINAKTIKKEKVFVSSTINDLQQERNTIRDVLKKSYLHPMLSEHLGFDLNHAWAVHAHDHCLDELKKCKSFIFIISENVGGKYSGSKYVNYANEIRELSNGQIAEPSISLMEYYLARKKKMKFFVFANETIMRRYAEGKLSNGIKCEIDFINHFPHKEKTKGNWIIPYGDLDNLTIRIRQCKF